MLTALAKEEEMQASLSLVANRMGIYGENCPGMIIADEIRKLHRTYEIPTLQDKGYILSDLLSCTNEIMSDQRLLPNCPVTVTSELVETVLSKMYYGN